MLSEERLPTLTDAMAKREEELYIPGSLYSAAVPPVVNEFPELTEFLSIAHPVIAARKVQMGNSNTFPRYRTLRDLRMGAKARTISRLAQFPEYGKAKGFNEYYTYAPDVPQLPTSWPELAGFGEVPVGATLPIGASPAVDRGFWGNLTNIITQAGEFFVDYKKAETQAATTAAQAELAKAQAAQQAALAGTAFTGNLPTLLLVGGILAAVFMTMPKKGGK